jgi:hypothetical protein
MTAALLPNVSFTVVSDPSHAWLIIAPQWVGTVGLNVAAFSRYSYVGNDGTLALEEDRDAKVFLDAYERNFGQTYQLQDVFEPRAQIRDWHGLH